MKTTSLELSKKLYEAFGWQTEFLWREIGALGWKIERWENHPKRFYDRDDTAPAYNTDFLLDKLPPRIQDDNGNWFSLKGYPNGIQSWFAYEGNLDGEDKRWPIDEGIPYYKRVFQDSNRAEALGNLALALKEKGLL